MIGVIGDLHLRDFLPYSEFVKDKRVEEEEKVLLSISNRLCFCDKIVILGDQFNAKNNTSETIRKFVSFISSFIGKDIYIIAGNHEIKNDGSTAIDFIEAAKTHLDWHVTASKYKVIDNMLFVPYMKKDDYESFGKDLPSADIAFFHQAITGMKTTNGATAEMFDEVVLPFEEVSKKYKLVFAGHIHKPQKVKNVYSAGSVFNCEVGETSKSVWIINNDLSVEELKLPGRGIYKIEDVSLLDSIPSNSIVKFIVRDKNINIEELENKYSSRFDAFIIIEQVEQDRIKIKNEEEIIDFDIKNLLTIYSKKKGLSLKELIRGLEMLN